MQKNNFRLKLDTKTVVGSNYSWIKRRQNIIEYLTQFKVRFKNAELSAHTHARTHAHVHAHAHTHTQKKKKKTLLTLIVPFFGEKLVPKLDRVTYLIVPFDGRYFSLYRAQSLASTILA